MSSILVIILLVLLLGGGGGYYGYGLYGGAGLGGALGLVLVIAAVLWFFGVIGGKANHGADQSDAAIACRRMRWSRHRTITMRVRDPVFHPT